jgi:hypothetical protein
MAKDRPTRAERKAAVAAKQAAALADFHARHRCCLCGEAANTIVITSATIATNTRRRLPRRHRL